MPRLPAWQCAGCKLPLGEVINGGRLRPFVVALAIGPFSSAFACPQCGVVNVWIWTESAAFAVGSR